MNGTPAPSTTTRPTPRSRRCQVGPRRPIPSPIRSPTTTAFPQAPIATITVDISSPIAGPLAHGRHRHHQRRQRHHNGHRLGDHRGPPATPSAWPPATPPMRHQPRTAPASATTRNGTFNYDPTNAAVFRDAAGRTRRPIPSPIRSPTTTAFPQAPLPPSPSTSYR